MANVSQTTLIMVRQFDVPTERVFDAWINPVMMRRWLMTNEGTNKIAVNEPYVGGRWTIVDQRDGIEYTATGEYLKIERPNLLIFTFQMPQFSELIDRLTVELRELEKGCEMTFTQVINVAHEEDWTEADIEKAHGENYSGSEHGWNLMFGGLKDILSLYALIQQIGPERLAELSDQALKNAGEDYFKNENAQAIYSLRYLGYVEHESALFTDVGVQLLKQLAVDAN
ncbi:SRPBCC domain-containing protein [Paenibacillus psychroresistens]|uniref:SRPBCC domain-containing protein n=1 Tax=Paenibacillus psychroresistens TaxID=1778678 RepID=A0A6B8RBB8_9BACL|nr:SRPBCC domain-containing protein [Paenibacillus psychroresistens]QGQ93891.1 SRPBCC domain-containing protein [Paenibacillus psychroresistens]